MIIIIIEKIYDMDDEKEREREEKQKTMSDDFILLCRFRNF